MLQNQEIGTATMTFDKQGNVTSAKFEPAMKIEFDNNVLKQLQKVDCCGDTAEDVNKIKQNAGVILGGWFSKQTEFELADMTRFQYESEVVKFETYPDDATKVKSCIVRFIFKDVSQN